MTLLELSIVLTVLTVAVSMYASSVFSLHRQRVLAAETAAVASAVRNQLETMRGQPFRQIALLYDRDPANDPAGPGTAPGRRFAVAGLEPLPEAQDGLVGTIVLPEVLLEDGAWQVREDQGLAQLGLPRDLSGDSIIDDLDHRGDYVRLPVQVRVDWQGPHGPRAYEVTTMLAEVRR